MYSSLSRHDSASCTFHTIHQLPDTPDIEEYMAPAVICTTNRLWLKPYTMQSLSTLAASEMEVNTVTKISFTYCQRQAPINRLWTICFAFCPENLNEASISLSVKGKYFKMERAIPTNRTSSTHVANLFTYNWIISFVIPTNLFTENGPELVNKLISPISGFQRY